MRTKYRNQAIRFRKSGMSYSEILLRVPVAKSTLSLWLRSVDLSRMQKQRLTEKKLASIRRGSEIWSQMRIKRTKIIMDQAISDVEKIKINSVQLWLIGVALYWAEGAKEKLYKPGQGVSFSNSDPKMVKVFLKWLKESLRISKKNIKLDIYIHDTHKGRYKEVRKYWSEVTGFSIPESGKIYYKKHKLSTKRKNIGTSYYGLLRIRVSRSTDLNRKITGWIEGIYLNCGVV